MTPDEALLREQVERRTAGRPKVEIRHAAGNFPNKGRRLKYGVEAALALDKMMDKHGIKVVSAAESYTAHRVAYRTNKHLRKQWRVIASRPNSVLPWGKVGNALIVSRELKLIRRKNCHVRFSTSRLGLNMPIATLEHPGGWRMTECAGHLPTTRAVSEKEWARQLRRVRHDVMAQAKVHGSDVAVISMDSNRSVDRVKDVLGDQWMCWAYDDVMQVWVNKIGKVVTKGQSGEIQNGYEEQLSDHDAMPWVDLVFQGG